MPGSFALCLSSLTWIVVLLGLFFFFFLSILSKRASRVPPPGSRVFVLVPAEPSVAFGVGADVAENVLPQLFSCVLCALFGISLSVFASR